MIGIEDFAGSIKSAGGLARPNLYRVILPTTIPDVEITGIDLNLLCKNLQLPGRQILTTERSIGPKTEKVAYSFGVDDISMTFYVTNQYEMKKYFDSWANLVFNQNSYEVNYKEEYVRDVEIHQLARGSTARLINQGPNEFRDLKTIYKIVLKDAFPTTVNAIELNNEQNGIVELNVQLSYNNWKVK
jgi:hypothetical protein